jgi:hypothetical protein
MRSRLLAAVLLSCAPCTAAPAAGDGLPTTFPSFVEWAKQRIHSELPPNEQALMSRLGSEDFRRNHPQLLDKMSRRFVELTDDWLASATERLGMVPASLVRGAEEDALEVERKLRAHFEERGWDYRSMKVIFVPRRLMAKKGERPRHLGRYMLLYPDAFFATLDPHIPRKHTLIHESLHFNKRGPHLGRPLEEGITEVAAARLSVEWGMSTREALIRGNFYPKYQRAVRFILDKMVERSDRTHDQALEILLRTYLTGDQSEVRRILGGRSWARIVAASVERNNLLKASKLALGE